jgi:hypothetical protein
MARLKQLPPIETRGPAGLILWLRRDQPALYEALANKVPEIADIEGLIRQSQLEGLGVFGKIGSLIAGLAKKAVPAIVKNLPAIASTAVQVGSQVLLAKEQTKVIKAQIKAAELNQPPAPTAEVVGQSVAVRDPVTGAVLTQPRVVVDQTREWIPGVPNPITLLGGGLLGVAVLKALKIL